MKDIFDNHKSFKFLELIKADITRTKSIDLDELS